MKEIQAISDKLDFSIQISLSVSQEMGLLFAKLDNAIPLYATLNSNSAEISLYLDREQRGKFEPSFGRMTHLSKGTVDIYELKAEELVFEFKMFRNLIRIPSVVPGGFYFSAGRVFADFRFHHSVMQEINQCVRNINDAKNKIKLSYLGPSDGLIKTILGINSRIPLSLITFTFEPEEGYVSVDDLAEDPFAEAKLFSAGMESDFDTVYYARKMSTKGRVVDVSEGIYESQYRTQFMTVLMDRVRKEKVPLASVLGRYKKDHIENFFFVPNFMADEMLDLILDSAKTADNASLKLTTFSPLERFIEELSN